jgi:hypothetical protein
MQLCEACTNVTYNVSSGAATAEQTPDCDYRYFGFSANGGGCPSKQGMVLRVLLCSFNMVIMSGLLVITGITFRYRKEKVSIAVYLSIDTHTVTVECIIAPSPPAAASVYLEIHDAIAGNLALCSWGISREI